MRDFPRRHPLLLYFVLACALFWGCIAVGFIDRFHFWVPILGAFAPGVAAIVASGLSGGEPGVRALLGKLGRWRVGLGWYLVALGLPFAEDALAAGFATVSGSFSAARMPPVLPILPAMWVVFGLGLVRARRRGFAVSPERSWQRHRRQLDRWYASCRVALACDPAAPSVSEWRSGVALVGVRLVRGHHLHMDLHQHWR